MPEPPASPSARVPFAIAIDLRIRSATRPESGGREERPTESSGIRPEDTAMSMDGSLRAGGPTPPCAVTGRPFPWRTGTIKSMFSFAKMIVTGRPFS